MADQARRPLPPDQPARDRIGAALDETLFVEAGAGSGKTTALVGRVLSLVTGEGADGRPHRPVPLSGIAAITFTEKAGAELRERLRRSLEEAATADPGHPRAELCRAALDELDGAAIGTLHSFAQRVLVEHPVEAGLPPRVEVLDEVTSGVEFEQRWARFSDELYADPAYARTFLLLFAAGVRDTTPHALARTFDANWDLVDEAVDPTPRRPARPGPASPACSTGSRRSAPWSASASTPPTCCASSSRRSASGPPPCGPPPTRRPRSRPCARPGPAPAPSAPGAGARAAGGSAPTW
jgi:hypothetical protein